MNLLRDPVFSVVLPGQQRANLSLPDVLARLSGDDILSFEALQIHQEQAWYCFLVQLAAIALARTSLGNLSDSPDDWRNALRELTPEFPDHEPWKLVVPDLSKPAFMQPPGKTAELPKFQDLGSATDALDVLILSKNHDVKARRVSAPRPEHWVFALVCLQTMEGFSGRDNYGIARMNGGFASRPWVGLAVDEAIGPRFRRDIQICADSRERLLDEYGYAEAGLALLWVPKWLGTDSLSLQELAPFFIEICRRIRLAPTGTGGELHAFFKSTAKARVAAKELCGNLGDPWIPVNRSKNASLTLSRAGLDYETLHRLLLGDDFRTAPCQEFQRDDPKALLFKGVGLTRGQGITEGFHSRTLPIPGKVRLMLSRQAERDRLRELSNQRIQDAATMQSKVLRPALLNLLQGAPDKLNLRDGSAAHWTSSFRARVDDIFFPQLWADADTSETEAARNWVCVLRDLAVELFETAVRSVPLNSADRYRVIAQAEGLLRGSLHKQFPVLAEQGEEQAS